MTGVQTCALPISCLHCFEVGLEAIAAFAGVSDEVPIAVEGSFGHEIAADNVFLGSCVRVKRIGAINTDAIVENDWPVGFQFHHMVKH